MRQRILFVDDDLGMLVGLRRMLRCHRHRWDMTFVDSVDEALSQMERVEFDAVVTDVMMPGKDGFYLLTQLRTVEGKTDIPVVMLTGAFESDLKRRALEHGASDLLNKPVAPEDLAARLNSALRLKSYQDQLKRHSQILEEEVRERTAELAASRLDIIWRLGKAAEYRDKETGNHIVRVGCYCRLLSEAMGLGSVFAEKLFLAGPLHDIGKIGIPDRILLKRGTLTDQERQTMQCHCAIGAEILRADPASKRFFLGWRPTRRDSLNKPFDDPVLATASTVALSHHEWWNGTGYPAGLSGEQIPLDARIVALADTYDALCSARPYKPAYSEDRAVKILSQESDRHFDPNVYAAFIGSLEELRAIRRELVDETGMESDPGGAS